jgi:hypothetical protein
MFPEPVTEVSPRAPATVIRAGRAAALPGFLHRRILAEVGPHDGLPAVGSLRWAVAICRAEIDWSVADWRRLDPLDPGPLDPGPLDPGPRKDGWGSHPSETYRLPHEQAAAAVLNAASHLQPTSWRLRELKRRLRAQRIAAADGALSEAHRLDWMERAEDSALEWRALWALRHRQMAALARALTAYRSARAAVDAVVQRVA